MSVCDVYGDDKIIQLYNISQISVSDIYFDWKRWVMQKDNSKYLSAFKYVGGDPTLTGQYLGITFFLINGWKFRPSNNDQTLVIVGNIYTDDDTPVFVSTVEVHNVAIQMSFSNLTTIIDNQLVIPTTKQIATEVWNSDKSIVTDNNSMGETLINIPENTWTVQTSSTTPGTFGDYVLNKILSIVKFVGLK